MDRRQRRHDLDRVFLVAPSSTPARLRSTAGACRGFVYAASTMGVTGVRDHGRRTAARSLVERDPGGRRPPGLRRARGLHRRRRRPRWPRYADGVIVGSAFVRACSTHRPSSTDGPDAAPAAAGALAAELLRRA